MAESRLQINIETGQSDKRIRQTTKELDRLTKSGLKSEKAAGSLSKGFSTLRGAVIRLAAAYGGFSVISGVISTTREFELAVSNLSAITGATGDDLDYLSNSARRLGKETTLSASQVVEAYKLVASAKPDLLESSAALESVTESTITLAEAAGIDLPEAANALGNALNQFGAEADQAGRFINVLAAGSKFGASSIADSAQALKDAGVSAAAANISFEELNASIQQLSLVGLRGSRAGVNLRNIILKLQKAGEDLDPTIHGLAGALENLNEKNLTAVELQKMFGLESVNAAQALLANTDSLRKLTKQVTGTNIAYEQAMINTDNLDGSIKRLNSAYEEMQLALGSKTNPMLRDFIDLITEGILALPDFLIELSNFRDFAIVEFERLFHRIEFGAKSLGNAFRFAFQNLGAVMTAPIKLAVEVIADMIDSITDRFGRIIPSGTLNTLNSFSSTLRMVGDSMLSAQDTVTIWAEEQAKLNAELDAANAVLDRRVISLRQEHEQLRQQNEASVEAAKATRDIVKAQKELQNAVEETTVEVKTFSEEMGIAIGNSMSRSVERLADTFVDFALTGKSSFSDMVQSMLIDIAKLITQMLFLRSLQAGLAGTSLGSFLFPSADGNVFQGGEVKAFAKGGVVNRPTVFPMARGGVGLAGEAGPEAIMPLTRDSSGKLGVKAEGAGVTVNVINQSTGTETEQRVSPDGRTIDVIIKNIVKAGIGNGSFDREFGAVYGLRRQGI